MRGPARSAPCAGGAQHVLLTALSTFSLLLINSSSGPALSGKTSQIQQGTTTSAPVQCPGTEWCNSTSTFLPSNSSLSTFLFRKPLQTQLLVGPWNTGLRAGLHAGKGGTKPRKCSGPSIKNLHYKDRKYRIMQ